MVILYFQVNIAWTELGTVTWIELKHRSGPQIHMNKTNWPKSVFTHIVKELKNLIESERYQYFGDNSSSEIA